MTTSQRYSDRLLECEQTIHALQEENAHLRQAAHDFGALAERLNTALKAERRAMAQWTSAMGRQRGAQRPGARESRAARVAAVAAVETHGH
jgi:hypothetical protein